MGTLLQDLRYGLRMLAKNPSFTAVATATLALGIGACTAVFTVAYGVLLRPLPYREPDRIMQVWQIDAEGRPGNLSDPNFQDLHDQNRTLQALAEYGGQIVTVLGGHEPARLMAASVSHEFFDAMGVKPVLGTAFPADQSHPGGTPVVLVGYGYWKNSLGGDTDLSRHKLTFGDRAYSVVGVMPPGFDFPFSAEVWVPRELWPSLPSRTALNWHAVGRLKDRASLSQARADLSLIARRLKRQYGKDTWMSDASVVPLQESMVGKVRRALLLLLGAAGILLLAACANTANLLLAKAASHGKELAVRVALGASRADLMRQFLAEALLLSLGAGALGVLVALWGVDALLVLNPQRVPRADAVSVNLSVLGFAVAVSMLAACGVALAPALGAGGRNLLEALRSGERRHSGGTRNRELRAALVASQVALATLLLVGASLLGRSFLRLLEVDPGFRASGVLTMDLFPPPAESEAAKVRRVRFLDELTARLRQIPGVKEVGAGGSLPLAGCCPNGEFLLVDRQEEVRDFKDFERLARDPARTDYADYQSVSEGYFRAMGIPLIQGRLFNQQDGPQAPHVGLISESLARKSWPGQNPIGRRIEFGNMDGDLRLLTIVGIVGDVHDGGLAAAAEPTVYVSCRQRGQGEAQVLSIVMHTTGNTAGIIPAARSILRELDPELPPRFRMLDEIVSSSLGDRSFNLLLLGVFGAAALLLAMMGIYGVMSFTVEERTQEIGIRMALGAQRGDVLRLVTGQGLRVAVLGMAIGIAVALGASRVLKSLLYGVSTHDPATFVAVALLLMAVALVACYIPARRATKVDPMVALRYQ